jgi:hypothetical protein
MKTSGAFAEGSHIQKPGFFKFFASGRGFRRVSSTSRWDSSHRDAVFATVGRHYELMS